MRFGPRALAAIGAAVVVALLAPITGAALRNAADVSPTAAVAAAAPAPGQQARAAWPEARRMADAGQFDSALVVIRSALRERPGDVDLRWLEAGVYGWAGRHREAVARYERLLADHPELARDVRADLAAQRLWAGDARGALRDFDLRLVEAPDDQDARRLRALALAHADSLAAALAEYDALVSESPDDADLALERARVLTWMGRERDAFAAYRNVVARHPGDPRARLGLATLDNWSGRHRRAAATLDSLAAVPGADPEVFKQLAFARWWAGESWAARPALATYRARVPGDREALDLSDRLARDGRRSLTVGAGRSDDSDGQRIRTTRMSLRLPFAPRTAAEMGWQRDNARDPFGVRDPLTLRMGLETAWSAVWSARATFDHVELGDSAGTTGCGEISLTCRPADDWRFDTGLAREVVMTRLALRRGVSVQTWVAGVDWDAAERLRLHADGRLRRYSDGNDAQQLGGSAGVLVWARRSARVRATASGQQLRTSFDPTRGSTGTGYYAPEWYAEWGPGLECEWTPGSALTTTVAGRRGWQHEKATSAEPFYDVSASAELTIARLWMLQGEAGRSDSNLSSDSGFELSRWAVAITRWF